MFSGACSGGQGGSGKKKAEEGKGIEAARLHFSRGGKASAGWSADDDERIGGQMDRRTEGTTVVARTEERKDGRTGEWKYGRTEVGVCLHFISTYLKFDNQSEVNTEKISFERWRNQRR